MMINYKQLFGLLIATFSFLGCAPKPYALEQNNAYSAEGSAFDTYDSYNNANGTNNLDPYAGGQTYAPQNGGGYAGGSNPSTADYYNHPQYGQNVVGGPAATAKDRIIYFSYDSSHIDNRSEAVIREHAKYLREHPQTMVVLEGHTDERGTREYNVGLGERRAYAVKDIFRNAGVGINQMRVLSYGEERPASYGSTELDYAKNRRVVIIY